MTERSPRLRPEEARRRAEERFIKSKRQEDEAKRALGDIEKQRQVEAAKTARLRALRLAKEAADRNAADRAPGAKADAAKVPAVGAAVRRDKARSS